MQSRLTPSVTCATFACRDDLTEAGSTLSVTPLCDTSYAIKETLFSVCVRLYGQQLVTQLKQSSSFSTLPANNLLIWSVTLLSFHRYVLRKEGKVSMLALHLPDVTLDLSMEANDKMKLGLLLVTASYKLSARQVPKTWLMLLSVDLKQYSNLSLKLKDVFS